MIAAMLVVGGTWPTNTPGSAARFWASRFEDALAEKYMFLLSALCLGDILAVFAALLVVGCTWPNNTPGSA